MALAVRPCRPITLPRSSGCTRSSRTVTCDPSTDFTCTSSGWSTRARAMASTSSFMWSLGMAPAVKPRTHKYLEGLRLSDLLQTEEAPHRIAGLRAKSHPILDTLRVELDLRRLLQRIIRAHRFLDAAVPRP